MKSRLVIEAGLHNTEKGSTTLDPSVPSSHEADCNTAENEARKSGRKGRNEGFYPF